jgi:hypothetical protein
MTIFYCLRFETPDTWRARSPYLYLTGTGWPRYTPGTGFYFRRLLRLAGLQWRYLNPPSREANPNWLLKWVTIRVKVTLRLEFIANQFVFAPNPLTLTTRDFLLLGITLQADTDLIENTVPTTSLILACVTVAAETYLPNRCLAIDNEVMAHYSSVTYLENTEENHRKTI